jgi:uncharacterized protein
MLYSDSMKAKKFPQFYIIRLERGEEIMETLGEFCEQAGIKSGHFSGIGACDQSEIAAYSAADKGYVTKKFEGDYEIISLNGTISDENIHVHIALSDHNMNMIGGHLNSARISATCEIQLTPGTEPISRFQDEETGLRLFDI